MKLVLAGPLEHDHKVIMMTLECLHFTVMLLQPIKIDDFLAEYFPKIFQPCHFNKMSEYGEMFFGSNSTLYP